MRGVILGMDGGRGVVTGMDQQRYTFAMSEWRGAAAPQAGQSVDFDAAGAEAKSVFLVPGTGGLNAEHSSAFVLGVISVVSLALGFVLPVLVPTIVAFVTGVIGAQQSQAEGNSAALVMARIGWIGSLVTILIGVILITGLFMFLGVAGLGMMHIDVHGWD